MGVDITSWRTKIGIFHQSSKSNRIRNGGKPLSLNIGPCIVPGLPLLLLAAFFVPATFKTSGCNQAWTAHGPAVNTTIQAGQAWITQRIIPSSTISSTISRQVNISIPLCPQQSTFLTDYVFHGNSYPNADTQHGGHRVTSGHQNQLLYLPLQQYTVHKTQVDLLLRNMA